MKLLLVATVVNCSKVIGVNFTLVSAVAAQQAAEDGSFQEQNLLIPFNLNN